jgi:hypothetical protein
LELAIYGYVDALNPGGTSQHLATNCLETAPLFDETGKVVFFMAGQINCSTTIHSNVEVMRMLSMSHEDEPIHQDHQLKTRPRRKSFFKAFRTSDRQSPPPPLPPPLPSLAPTDDTGLEHKATERAERAGDLKAQIREFYSVYSKYMVVRAEDFTIRFFSTGVVETLVSVYEHGGAAGNGHPVVGQDIFRFLKQHQPGPIQSDFKNTVKKAIRSGLPVSIGVRLQTRRSIVYRGDENFMTHWTPMKNEHGAVHWVVITLASLTPAATGKDGQL